MEQRFSLFIDVTDDRLSPLAAAACFVDPSVSTEVLIENEDEAIQDLLKKAEDYITRSVTPRIQEEEKTEMKKRKTGRQRLQRQPLCQSGLDLGFSVPVIQQGSGPLRPLSGRRFRNTKTGCPKLLTLRNLGVWSFGLLRVTLCLRF